MAKKKKRRIQAPSLSPFDKKLYALLKCISILSLIGGIFLFAIPIRSFRISVFVDPHVLAQTNYNSVLIMLGFIPGIILVSVFETLRIKKQPIFGKAGITYGPPKWKPVYPLFSLAFWKNLGTQPRKVILTLSCLMLVVLAITLVTALVMPLRICLYDDGTITRFDCLDRPAEQYDLSDIEQMTLYTETYYRRRGPDPWVYSLKMTTYEGETFYFEYNDFDLFSGTHGDVIQEMMQIKGWFSPERINIEGTAQLEEVVRDMNLSEEERDLLYQLFSEP